MQEIYCKNLSLLVSVEFSHGGEHGMVADYVDGR